MSGEDVTGLQHTSAKSVFIPASAVTIRAKAFDGSGIERVVHGMPPSLKRIEMRAFYGTPLDAFGVPETVEALGDLGDADGVFEKSRLRTINFWGSSGLGIIGKDCFRCSLLEEIVLPPALQKMGCSVFYECAKLRSCSFGVNSKLGFIDDSCFYNCGALVSLSVPDGVVALPLQFCRGCSSLSSVTSGASSQLQKIGDRAFHGCTALKSVEVPSVWEELGEDALPSGCKLRRRH